MLWSQKKIKMNLKVVIIICERRYIKHTAMACRENSRLNEVAIITSSTLTFANYYKLQNFITGSVALLYLFDGLAAQT